MGNATFVGRKGTSSVTARVRGMQMLEEGQSRHMSSGQRCHRLFRETSSLHHSGDLVEAVAFVPRPFDFAEQAGSNAPCVR